MLMNITINLLSISKIKFVIMIMMNFSKRVIETITFTKNKSNLQNTINTIKKFHVFTNCQRASIAIVNNYISDFHDKKRKFNYYKIKKLLMIQQGINEPLEITSEESSSDSSS